MTFIHQETSPKVFLTLDDESKIEVETMLVMVSNTPAFGKNFLVAPGASLQDGLLDISVYPDFSKVELIRYYAAVMDGGYSGDGKVQRYQARKLKVKSSPKLEVMADGVALGKGTVNIKMRPGALRVITAEKTPGFAIPPKDDVEIYLRLFPDFGKKPYEWKFRFQRSINQEKEYRMPEQKGQKPVEKINEDVQQAARAESAPHLYGATGLFVSGSAGHDRSCFWLFDFLVKTMPSFAIDLQITRAIQQINFPFFSELMVAHQLARFRSTVTDHHGVDRFVDLWLWPALGGRDGVDRMRSFPRRSMCW